MCRSPWSYCGWSFFSRAVATSNQPAQTWMKDSVYNNLSMTFHIQGADRDPTKLPTHLAGAIKPLHQQGPLTIELAHTGLGVGVSLVT